MTDPSNLAQHATPTPVARFLADLIHPGPGARVIDPAVGAGELLAALACPVGPAGVLVGADRCPEVLAQAARHPALVAVQGLDLREADTLETIAADSAGQYDVVVCNPPFGTRLVERRPEVLAAFDLGHRWSCDADGSWRRGEVLARQEVGILFVEACVRLASEEPRAGRVAVIVPNGYLGNRATRYAALRDWTLRHARVAAIVGFPRFTFKGSGADVSASVMVLERRPEPLANSRDADDAPVAFELIEQLGWKTSIKAGRPTWERDEGGAIVLDAHGRPQEAQDFDATLARLRHSAAGEVFAWLAAGVSGRDRPFERGHTVAVSEILADPLRCLDPKRFSAKHRRIVATIRSREHFQVGDVAVVVPELDARQVRDRPPGARYRYVEISDVSAGAYASTDLPGWQLPTRARHTATPGDVFVGAIWGSVSKWFVAGPEAALIVTNGFHRLQLHADEDYVDLLAGLCTEAFAVQMRALARGSDGLAEITANDLGQIVLPRVTDPAVRGHLTRLVTEIRQARPTLKATVDDLTRRAHSPFPSVLCRPSHAVLV